MSAGEKVRLDGAAAGRRVGRGLLLALVIAWVGSLTGPVEAADPGSWKDARKAFRRFLRTDDWQTRHVAYEQFAKHDRAETVEEMLSKLVKEKSHAVVLRGLGVLAGFRSEDAQEALVAPLRRKSGTRRLYALLALRDQPGPAGKDELLAILRGRATRDAAQAALALGRKGIHQALPLLIADLSHEEWQRRAAAARAIEDLADHAAFEVYTERVPPNLAVAANVIQSARAASQDAAEDATRNAVGPLVEALERGTGSERGAIIHALERITGLELGWDAAAWRQVLDGVSTETLARNPRYPPHAVGIPLYGRRLVIIVGTGVHNEDEHPFRDRERLESLCKVPGARDVPWIRLRTKRQFYYAHAARVIGDLPDEAKFEVIGPTLNLHRAFGRLTSANPGTRDSARRFLDDLVLENGVDHHGALHRALDVSGRRDSVAWLKGPDEVLVLAGTRAWRADVVDGHEIGAEIALKARLRMVPIHAVGVGSHPDDLLIPLAEQTGGRYLGLWK